MNVLMNEFVTPFHGGPFQLKNNKPYQKPSLSETVAWFKIIGSSLCDTSDNKSRGMQLDTSIWSH